MSYEGGLILNHTAPLPQPPAGGSYGNTTGSGVVVTAAGEAHAGNWREVTQDLEGKMAGLVDEYMNIEADVTHLKETHNKDLQAARNREALLVTACDKLLSYTCRVEQQVLIPAVGSVHAAFTQFHEVAEARAQGMQATEALVSVANYPRLAALFSTLRAPLNRHAGMKKYQQQMYEINLDDAFNLAVTSNEENNALMDLLSQTAVSLGGLSNQPMSPSPHRPARNQGPPSPGTMGKISDLQAEVERLRANQQHGLGSSSSPQQIGGGNASQQQLAAENRILEEQLKNARNDAGSLHQRIEALSAQLKSAQNDSVQLEHRVQLQAAGARDQVVAQLQTDNDNQRRQLFEQEQQIIANEEERKAVGVSFANIKQALEQQANSNQSSTTSSAQVLEMEKMIKQLEQDNQSLQADLDDTHTRMKEASNRSEEKVRRLTKEKLVLQQEVATTVAAKDSGVDAFLSDVHRSQNAGAGPDASLGTINGLVHDTLLAQQYQTKIKAFEMTISALNVELAHLEDNVLETQRHAEVEKTQLHEEFENERSRLVTEAKELDLVVDKMSSELERILSENEELRMRLRSSSAVASRPVPLPAGTYKAPPPPQGPVAIPLHYPGPH